MKIKILLVSLFTLFFAAELCSCDCYRLSIEKQYDISSLTLEGIIVSSNHVEGESGNIIANAYQVEVLSYIKGDLVSNQFFLA